MADLSNLFSLKGRVAVVTGSTGVLGKAFVKGLASYGAKIVVTGRKQDVCDSVVAELYAMDSLKGIEIIGKSADVTKRDDLERLRDLVLEKWGRVDILVNCAGGNVSAAVIADDKSFFDMPEDALDQVLKINVLGTVLPCLVFGKELAKSPSASIVNISSMAAEKPAITRVMGYSASKAAISNFTHWLATDLAKKHNGTIRVNAISPGFFIGEQNRRLLLNEDGTPTPRGELVLKGTPMNRFGQPEELIGTLIWLCSDASKFVTGTVTQVDGGFSAYSGV
eukprot:CAMPEP_0204863050 /NCGR_PEP_ID=MMETSP1348-20121228/3021_1 /ASSEMBLY_ACC=CAM_ASM_000700 /TAXON_ID=215587 /ORGANISM="Aplanochytrium stocchinoi, Strain GSBS06" /LENGTH=279 /DNA_ID=CAMNT_0052013263 /DNA_START=55 /DNA_END=894 /DNA_ORIENTATION=-